MKQLISLTLPDAQQALNPVYEFQAVKGFFLLGASFCAQSFGGAPTNAILTVYDDAAAILSVTHATAGAPAVARTTGLGGSAPLPAHIDTDSVVALGLSFTGGASPSVTKALVHLWIDADE